LAKELNRLNLKMLSLLPGFQKENVVLDYDSVIENLFSNLIISINCGSEKYPAMLIEPEFIDITRKTNGFGSNTPPLSPSVP